MEITWVQYKLFDAFIFPEDEEEVFAESYDDHDDRHKSSLGQSKKDNEDAKKYMVNIFGIEDDGLLYCIKTKLKCNF